ncbi:MAG: anion permease, partial [Bdellovibrionales bacterium]|nr:anion permease [Bdellovibrionales bacterium]
VAVMIPLALETSTVLGLNSMPFVIAVTLASSCCFITPFEPVLMLVFGPGRYSMKDFVKVGLPLALIASVIATLIIPIVWPLVP